MDADARERVARAGPSERRSQPHGLRRARGRAGAPGRAPDAVTRLGEVDQLEVQPERADDALERLGIHGQDVERDPLPCLGSARGDRAEPRRLDELEDLAARLLHDDLAEQRAEEPHLPRRARSPLPEVPMLRGSARSGCQRSVPISRLLRSPSTPWPGRRRSSA